MKQKLSKRILFVCDDEFKDSLKKLETHYETRGMSATIRRAVILAVRSLPKTEAKHDEN